MQWQVSLEKSLHPTNLLVWLTFLQFFVLAFRGPIVNGTYITLCVCNSEGHLSLVSVSECRPGIEHATSRFDLKAFTVMWRTGPGSVAPKGRGCTSMKH